MQTAGAGQPSREADMESVTDNRIGVYQIRNTANGKVYIGSTVAGFTKRWGIHRVYLQQQKHHCKHLQAAWNKYGESVFTFEVLEAVDDLSMAVPCEQAWIDSCRDRGMALYNSNPNAGSARGKKHTAVARANMSAAQRAASSRPEWRQKQSQIQKDVARSPVIRARLAAQSRAYHSTPEARQAQSDRARRAFASPEARAAIAERSRQRMADPNARAHIAEVNRQRMSDLDVRKELTAAAHAVLRSPEGRQAQSERAKRIWSDPDLRAKALAGMRTPEYRAKIAAGTAKTYPGFVAPDGTIYAPVTNLAAFCREHKLGYRRMQRLAYGQTQEHGGWTRHENQD